MSEEKKEPSLVEKEMGKSVPVEPVSEDKLINVDDSSSSNLQSNLLKFSKLMKVKVADKVVFLPSTFKDKVSLSDSDSQKIFQWYLNEVLETKSSERTDRYKEYMFMDNNCFTGDTEIPLLDGKVKKIKDLQEYPEFFVYSFDTEKNKVVVGRGHSARKTGVDVDVYEVTLNNGKKVKATSNHRWLLKDGKTYKQTCELKENDSLSPLYLSMDSHGYLLVKQPDNYHDYVHHLSDNFNLESGVYSDIRGIKHHKNFIKTDNYPTNICQMAQEDHSRLHINNVHKNIHSNPALKEKMKQIKSETMKKTWEDNYEYMSQCSSIRQRERIKDKSYREFLSKVSSEKTIKNPELKKLYSETAKKNTKKRWSNSVERDKQKNLLSEMWKDGRIKPLTKEENKNNVILREQSRIRIVANKLIENGFSLDNWDDCVDSLVFEKRGQKRYLHSVLKYFGSISNLKTSLEYNHTVLSVSYYGKEDVYDFTVDKYHNFALAAGVFVHNSSEISSGLDAYADEAVQLGKVSTGIIAESNDPVLKSEINKLLSKLRLNNINFLRDMARGLAKYGDKPFAVEVTSKGVEAIEPVDPMNFTRLEKYIKLSPEGEPSFFNAGGKPQNISNSTFDTSFYDMDDTKGENFTIADYRPYLLGFKIHDKVVPPWNCVHFRLFSSESDFYPYGRAIIESVRPTYRHLLSLEILMSLIKSTKFKKTNFHLKVNGTYDNPYELFDKLNEMRQAYNDHVVGESTRQRNPTQTSDIWTAETNDSSLTVKPLDTALDTKDAVEDVTYLQNKLYMGLRMPKSYLLNDKTDNNSGDALIQQDLKFARLIYMLQSSILAGVVRIIQIHLVATGKQDKINSFSLSLPYPVPAYNLIELKAQSDRLDHVKKFGELLKDTFGVEKLPLKTIKRLLCDMAHMNDTLIDNIIKDLELESIKTQTPKEETGTTIQDNNPGPTEEIAKESVDNKFDKIKKKLEEELNKKILTETISEWEDNNRHHLHSRAYSMTDDIILHDTKTSSDYRKMLMEATKNEMDTPTSDITSTQELTETSMDSVEKKKILEG